MIRRISLIGMMLAITFIARTEAKLPGNIQRPNIIYIMLDDLGYFNFTCNGGTAIDGEPYRTPNIDRLAREGMRLTNCHSRAMCNPTRRVLMTGKGLYDVNRGGTPLMDMPWIPQILQEAGYVTGISGKWMLGKLNPLERGFDEAFIWGGHYQYNEPRIMVFNSGGYMKDLNQPGDVNIQTNAFDLSVGGGPGKAVIMRDHFGSDLILQFSCDFISRHADEPFFLYYPMKLIHGPNPTLPGETKRASNPDLIEYADRTIQQLVEAVDKAGIANKTLIMVTSDNGFFNQKAQEVHDTVQWFPGKKGSAYEGSTRVPFIARWSGTIEAGTTYEGLVDFTDMLPTFTQLAGATLPKGETWGGRSFMPQLLGEKGNPRRWIYVHHGWHPNPLGKAMGEFYTQGNAFRYIRGVHYKLYGDGRFYNMAKDIKEENNIELGSGSPEAEEARRLLQSVLNCYEPDGKEETHAPRVEIPAFDMSTLPPPITGM